MNKNSLVTAALLLAVTLGGLYYYKTNGEGFKKLEQLFSLGGPADEAWKRDDPGWERHKAEPDPMPQEQPPPQEQPKEQPKQQPRQNPG